MCLTELAEELKIRGKRVKKKKNRKFYKYGSAREALTKYCNKSAFGDQGVADGQKSLEADDDVAHVNWGGAWTMPTKAQIDELQKECFWV